MRVEPLTYIYAGASSYETLKEWQYRYIIRFYVRLLEDSTAAELRYGLSQP